MKATSSNVGSMIFVKNGALQRLGPYKKGKDLISKGGHKIHLVSEQLLSFGIIRIHSRRHYYVTSI